MRYRLILVPLIFVMNLNASEKVNSSKTLCYESLTSLNSVSSKLNGMAKDILQDINLVASELEAISKNHRIISVVGSSALKENSMSYQEVFQLVTKLSKRKIAVLTGGGPGIMDAANKAAFLMYRPSIGLDLESQWEPHPSDFMSHYLKVSDLSIRKKMFQHYSKAIIVADGGLGTLDEMFHFVSEIYSGKSPKIPIVLLGKRWRKFEKHLRDLFVEELGTMKDSHLNYWQIADSVDEAIKLLE